MGMIDKIRKEDLKDFANKCQKLFNADSSFIFSEAQKAIKYYNGNKEIRQELRSMQKLEEQWYSSLPENPDYSVYNGIDILPDLWACWKIYSRDYLRSIVSPKSSIYYYYEQEMVRKNLYEKLKDVKTIVDLGCGIGYTTATIKEFFPNAKVYATNLSNSMQYDFCKSMSDEYNFTLVEDIKTIGKVDLVFAFEYFEHFYEPTKHFDEIEKYLNPEKLFIANSFGSMSVGHFNTYKINEKEIVNKKVGRAFTDYLKSNGYTRCNTDMWNDRPAFWEK